MLTGYPIRASMVGLRGLPAHCGETKRGVRLAQGLPDALRTWRLPKVWLHVALSVLAMNGAALAKVRAGE